jgi:transcriptional regulator with XRE-family HTH domain
MHINNFVYMNKYYNLLCGAVSVEHMYQEQETNRRIARNLRTIRELKGLKQGYIAKHLGITPNGYGKIERGETSISVERLETISQIYGVSLMDILQMGTLRNESSEADGPHAAQSPHTGSAEAYIWHEMTGLRTQVKGLQDMVLQHSKLLEKLLSKKK